MSSKFISLDINFFCAFLKSGVFKCNVFFAGFTFDAKFPSSSTACNANNDCNVYLLKYVIAEPIFCASKSVGNSKDDSTDPPSRSIIILY